MKFSNEIELDLPADELFATLADVERVALCLPGAQLEGSEGDLHRGAMRVKVGPIVVDYAGTLTIEELDPKARRAVLVARGKERTGQGSAEASIVNSVEDLGDRSRIVVETDLLVKGKVAQFGSGPMEKIAKRMFAEFAANLEAMMKAGGGGPGSSGGGAEGPRDRAESSPSGQPQPDSLNLLGLVADTVPLVARATGLGLLGLLLGFLLGRLSASSP